MISKCPDWVRYYVIGYMTDQVTIKFYNITMDYFIKLNTIINKKLNKIFFLL